MGDPGIQAGSPGFKRLDPGWIQAGSPGSENSERLDPGPGFRDPAWIPGSGSNLFIFVDFESWGSSLDPWIAHPWSEWRLWWLVMMVIEF